jgi:Ankyrin repeats (many copies)
MVSSDLALRELVSAIIEGDTSGVLRLLAVSPGLATASFQSGATRQSEEAFFLDKIKKYLWRGDTALHVAAAAYRAEIVRRLVASGADVHARSRLGDEALHAAAVGIPGSPTWDPQAQAATIVTLIEAGANPNAVDRNGVTPLHRAARTRCAAAVRTLLEHGADPTRKNKHGSTPMLLACMNTGRGGSGSPEAKAQQQQIVRMLEEHGCSQPDSE